jgi:hypothetical protein
VKYLLFFAVIVIVVFIVLAVGVLVGIVRAMRGPRDQVLDEIVATSVQRRKALDVGDFAQSTALDDAIEELRKTAEHYHPAPPTFRRRNSLTARRWADPDWEARASAAMRKPRRPS